LTLQYSQTKRAWSPERGFYQQDCAPRIVEALYGRAYIRKLWHKRHGQNEVWFIKQNPDYLEDQERKAKKLRKMQKLSRKINRV
jgi:hypothetical protein